ncbi:MAG: flagellar basal body rod protein FlgC [Proteobacteria bacterium]|nr:flagellar basal body rod protein FlgC [Pseudomonadota bacterium]
MADIFSIVGSALDSQNARMGVIASNLANVDSVTPPGGTPYRAHEVVFQAQPVSSGSDGWADSGQITSDATDLGAGTGESADGAAEAGSFAGLGVSVAGTVLSNAAPAQTYEPGSPYANSHGYVTGSNVSQIGQMVDLIDSSNSYAADVAVLQQAARIDQQMLSSFQVS